MVANFTPPSFSQILQSAIDNYNSLAKTYGYNINITPTDEVYIRLSTYAAGLASLYQYTDDLTNSKIVDTATGTDLDRVANFLGIYRKAAGSSQGAVLLVSSANQTLLAGTILTGPNGLTFQVATSGVYSNGQNVVITSVDQGSQTNLDTSSIMNWQSPTSTMQTTAIVSVACTGGVDAETDETLRARCYLTLQSPPNSGNASQLITISSTVDNIIQQAFTYSNFNGAGTQLITLLGYQTNSYVGRDIPHLPFDGYITTYGITQLNPSLVPQVGGFGAYNKYTLAANNFGQNLSADSAAIYGQISAIVANPFATVITTANNTPTDVAAVLTIPYPVGSATNGVGGGWNNNTPWPVPDGYYVQNFCSVVSIQSSTSITVSAPSSGTTNTNNPYASSFAYTGQSPVQGQTQISWVNRSDANQAGWQIVNATVVTAIDNANQTWSITLDTPLVFATGSSDFYGNTSVAVGDFIFPASNNGQTYLNNLLTSYSLIGPGEVTSDQGLLALGAARFPGPNTTFSNILGSSAEKLLEINNEVFSATVDPGNGSTIPGAGVVFNCYNTAASAPSNNCPPNIFIPRNIATYPKESYNFGI